MQCVCRLTMMRGATTKATTEAAGRACDLSDWRRSLPRRCVPLPSALAPVAFHFDCRFVTACLRCCVCRHCVGVGWRRFVGQRRRRCERWRCHDMVSIVSLIVLFLLHQLFALYRLPRPLPAGVRVLVGCRVARKQQFTLCVALYWQQLLD